MNNPKATWLYMAIHHARSTSFVTVLTMCISFFTAFDPLLHLFGCTCLDKMCWIEAEQQKTSFFTLTLLKHGFMHNNAKTDGLYQNLFYKDLHLLERMFTYIHLAL